MLKSIKTGDRADIGFKEGGNERRRFSTAVEAVLGDTEILILMPISAGVLIKLPFERSLEARFYTKSGAIIMYTVTVLEHLIVEGAYLTRLQLNSEGERLQFRQFYRVDSAVEFKFSVAGKEVEEKGLILYKSLTKNLSGGGMKFVANLKLDISTEIYATLVLDEEYIVVLGMVLDRQDVAGESYKYQYRCQFLYLPYAEQEKIVKFVNTQQYKSIRRESD